MDIVERLRSVTRLLRKTEETSYEQDDTLAKEAANEIERLREENKKLQVSSKPYVALSCDDGFGGSPMQYDYNRK